MFKGSITALITPFKNEGKEIDFEALERMIHLQIAHKSDAIVIGGTTGETPTLEEKEFKELVTSSLAIANKKIPVIVGTGTFATKKTCENTLFAKHAGADGALVIVPYYNKPKEEGVISHFHEVSKIGLPLIMYHHPGRTGLRLSVETLTYIASMPNVVGIKDCSDSISLVDEILRKRPETILLTGIDNNMIEMMQKGVQGNISVIANLVPDIMREIAHFALKNAWDDAIRLFNAIKPLLDAIEMEPNPIGIKCALSLEGLCEDTLRLPLTSASKRARDAIKSELNKSKKGELLPLF